MGWVAEGEGGASMTSSLDASKTQNIIVREEQAGSQQNCELKNNNKICEQKKATTLADSL